MATYYKRSAAGTTNLASNTVWDGTSASGAGPAGPPTSADIAQWDATSLRAALTGALSANSLVFNGAGGNATHSGATVTVGTGGMTFALTNNGYWQESGAIDVGANNQTWSIYNSAQSSSVWFAGTSTLSGSATINITNTSPSADANFAYIYSSTTGVSSFSGILDFQSRTGYSIGTANLGANAQYRFNGTGAFVFGSTSGVNTWTGASITINGDVDFGNSITARTITTAMPIAFGSVTRTISVTTGTTFSGAITGTAGFTKAGASALTISGTNNSGLSGTITVSASSQSTVATSIVTNLPNITAYALSVAGATQDVRAHGTATTTTTGATFSGLGIITAGATASAANTLTFSSETALGSLTGTTAPSGYVNSSGFLMYTYNTNSICVVYAKDLPSTVTYFPDVAGGTRQMTLRYNSGKATHSYTSTKIYMHTGMSGPATSTNELYADQATGALVIGDGTTSTGIARTGVDAGTSTFTLRGSSAADNTIAGIIQNPVGTLVLSKADAGKWILSGANTFTGGVSISAGTLSAQSAGAFGSSTTGAVSQTGGIIDVSGGVTVNKASTTLTLVSVASATNLSSTSGTNTYSCAGVTLNSTAVVDVASGASLNLNNSAAMSGSGFGVTKTSAGEFILTNAANTFTGAITVSAGTLTAVKLDNASANSSIGTGAGTSAIALTGTLKHIGTTVDSTNRSITFTGSAPSLDASGTGSGAITFSAATQAAGARTITFTGLGTNNNTFSAALSNGTGTVAITKDGVGKWILSNATLNFTGALTVANGTLDLNSTARSLSSNIVMSGGTLQNGSATVTPSASVTMTGGTITANLSGASKTLSVSSGSATLAPQANDNVGLTGGTATIAGTLRLTTESATISTTGGKVLGSMATTVQAGGTIQTTTGINQRGQHRYGGNLTFQAGATLRIGG